MGRMLAFVTTIVLCGCGSASDAQKEAAMETLVVCMQRQAGQLDDRKSDASTIAYAVRAACRSELQDLINTYEAGLTTYASDQNFERKITDGVLATAMKIVLQERQSHY
jgi:hypothetical protein